MSVVAELRQTEAEIGIHGTQVRMSYPVDLTTRTRNGRCKRVKPETEKRRNSFLARQMALAIKLRRLWERDTELSFADLARMEKLTRARICIFQTIVAGYSTGKWPGVRGEREGIEA